MKRATIAFCFVTVISFVSAGFVSQSNTSPLRVEYIVEVKDTAAHLFHVTATFRNLQQPYLDLALPVWTPGVYTAENYARNIRRFTVRNESGTRLPAPKVQPSAWRIDTRRLNKITVEFDFIATTLAWNKAAITSEYAFFTGTELFLEPVGYRNISSTVRFIVPTGWRIASALRDTKDSLVFTAKNYDELVDAPTVLGSFDVRRVDVDAKPHFLVTVPAGAYTSENLNQFVQMLPQVIRLQRNIFGSLPYDKYLFFYFSPKTNMSGGALEHSNSSVYPAGDSLTEAYLGGVAHEFFHLWNVKRIRPAQMWPYDYSRVNPGPSLWVSEGITNYYGDLIYYRAGLQGRGPAEGIGAEVNSPSADPETNFLRALAAYISQLETEPERHYNSPSDASISDGMTYGAVSPSYYTSGAVIGVLLDLSILHDTKGKRRLDDVMSTLSKNFYERRKGFTPDDFIKVVNRTAGRDYSDFFRRYVKGTEVPPYDRFFGYAGYTILQVKRQTGVLGVTARSTPEGRQVYRIPGAASPASLAGIRVGDVILAIDDVPIHQVPLINLYGKNWIGGRFPGRAGERVVIKILRNDKELEIPVTLGTREEINYYIQKNPAATPQQLAIRNAWLKR